MIKRFIVWWKSWHLCRYEEVESFGSRQKMKCTKCGGIAYVDEDGRWTGFRKEEKK